MSVGDLWRQILDQSNLAYVISCVYRDISQSKIAHVLLNNKLAVSLQIPIVSEISVLPSLTDPQVPGLSVSVPALPSSHPLTFHQAINHRHVLRRR
jgi:hypothetical protein